MASRIVRKVKRVKRDSFLNDLKENAPVGTTMKVAANLLEGKNVTIKPAAEMAEFNVSQLIAELSENTKVPKVEIENIQRRLLQQANEILKVNAFANSTNQPVPEPRIVNTTQKYDNNKPVYGRPIQRDDQDMRYNSMVARDNQLDPQLVPEKLEMSPDGACGMINGGGNGNMLRVGTSPAQGTRGFFYGTGSATARLAASARAAPIRGECLSVFVFKLL
ncbi:putative Type IV pilin biogenesis protein [Operophtera brumata]|uniref:Putative Type IV pilin biogenesis protein n=1 Tax=Operophtera brumata TaxID=104452 RepID=A0A0L7L2R4_OPEBR|nr:putative Type IV pilin biogenesis protein [Operophtera brumata]